MYWIMLEKITFSKKTLILYGNITGTVGSYMYTMTMLCLNIAIRNAFFLTDVDDIKSMNDINGYMTGDSTLKKFASVLTNPFRFQEQIEAAREEFPFLSISVGAYVTDRRHTYEQYYEEADKALYETKKNGKNDYTVRTDVGSSVKIRRGTQAFAG